MDRVNRLDIALPIGVFGCVSFIYPNLINQTAARIERRMCRKFKHTQASHFAVVLVVDVVAVWCCPTLRNQEELTIIIWYLQVSLAFSPSSSSSSSSSSSAFRGKFIEGFRRRAPGLLEATQTWNQIDKRRTTKKYDGIIQEKQAFITISSFQEKPKKKKSKPISEQLERKEKKMRENKIKINKCWISVTTGLGFFWSIREISSIHASLHISGFFSLSLFLFSFRKILRYSRYLLWPFK